MMQHTIELTNLLNIPTKEISFLLRHSSLIIKDSLTDERTDIVHYKMHHPYLAAEQNLDIIKIHINSLISKEKV
ncbi:hypothetical protein D1872_62090 [compost metagenome]